MKFALVISEYNFSLGKFYRRFNVLVRSLEIVLPSDYELRTD